MVKQFLAKRNYVSHLKKFFFPFSSGRSSKDFAKWAEEVNSVKPNRCLVIFYGNDFNLKTLSVVALSGDEREVWLKGLNYLIGSIRGSTYRTAQERMFRKSFYALEQPTGTMVVQERHSSLFHFGGSLFLTCLAHTKRN